MGVLLAVTAGFIFYQSTHFNRNFTINGVKVGGLTAEQALKNFKSMTLKNDVYLNGRRIIKGKDTQSNFTNSDLSAVKKVLKSQFTLWPSAKVTHYSLIPEKADDYRNRVLKKEVAAKLHQMNKKLKAPIDAKAILSNGKITVSKSKNGEQYDITKMLKAYDRRQYDKNINLNVIRLQPIQADSHTVSNEKQKLRELLRRTTDYQLQDNSYSMQASNLIKNASVSKTMKITVDTGEIKKKLALINQKTSTLNKNYAFKTHTGSVISVKGQSYGWALHVPAEANRIAQALVDGKKTIKAYNVYGVGFSTYGVGYKVRGNNGIGGTYAEVSISEQRIWLYKNGKMVLTTQVVTGRHNTHEDTPKGVWYIEYKQSPSVLEGSEAGNPHYKVKVKYWAPFTLSGCGFHDAPWRHNWAKNAYLTQGSGGCVNTPPSAMVNVYQQLEQNEPVIVY